MKTHKGGCDECSSAIRKYRRRAQGVTHWFCCLLCAREFEDYGLPAGVKFEKVQKPMNRTLIDATRAPQPRPANWAQPTVLRAYRAIERKLRWTAQEQRAATVADLQSFLKVLPENSVLAIGGARFGALSLDPATNIVTIVSADDETLYCFDCGSYGKIANGILEPHACRAAQAAS